MPKKTIISIAGKPGSGKSTTGKLLAQQLGYKHESTGDFIRMLAEKRGITLDQLTHLAETDPAFDEEFDRHNTEVGKGEKIVIDSRLGFHFIPDSFKVFLDIDNTVAAERILSNIKVNQARKNESRYNFDSIKDVASSITKRLASERLRYKKMYSIQNHTAPENFDLVIHTDSPEFSGKIEAVVEKIKKEYENWLNLR